MLLALLVVPAAAAEIVVGRDCAAEGDEGDTKRFAVVAVVVEYRCHCRSIPSTRWWGLAWWRMVARRLIQISIFPFAIHV